MIARETPEKPQAETQEPASAAEQDKRPCGTMFDPESIRKFLDQKKTETK